MGPSHIHCIYSIHITYFICDVSFGGGRLPPPTLQFFFFYGREIITVALLKRGLPANFYNNLYLVFCLVSQEFLQGRQ